MKVHGWIMKAGTESILLNVEGVGIRIAGPRYPRPGDSVRIHESRMTWPGGEGKIVSQVEDYHHDGYTKEEVAALLTLLS